MTGNNGRARCYSNHKLGPAHTAGNIPRPTPNSIGLSKLHSLTIKNNIVISGLLHTSFTVPQVYALTIGGRKWPKVPLWSQNIHSARAPSVPPLLSFPLLRSSSSQPLPWSALTPPTDASNILVLGPEATAQRWTWPGRLIFFLCFEVRFMPNGSVFRLTSQSPFRYQHQHVWQASSPRQRHCISVLLSRR